MNFWLNCEADCYCSLCSCFLEQSISVMLRAALKLNDFSAVIVCKDGVSLGLFLLILYASLVRVFRLKKLDPWMLYPQTGVRQIEALGIRVTDATNSSCFIYGFFNAGVCLEKFFQPFFFELFLFSELFLGVTEFADFCTSITRLL